MRVPATALFCLISATAWPPLPAAADDPPTLVHNPFSRPPSEVTGVRDSIIERDDGDGQAIDLRATMIGGVSKLANVAGRILKPGDEIEDYKLIAVYERYAVFRRNNKMMTVYVRPNQAEDDE